MVVRSCADAVSARRAPPNTSVMLALSGAISALVEARGLRESMGTVQAAVLARMLVSGASIPIADEDAGAAGIGSGVGGGASVSVSARLAMLSGGIVRNAGVGEASFDAHSVMRGGVAASTRAWLREKLDGALTEDERIAFVNVIINVGELENEMRLAHKNATGEDIAEKVMGLVNEQRDKNMRNAETREEFRRANEARQLYRRRQERD